MGARRGTAAYVHPLSMPAPHARLLGCPRPHTQDPVAMGVSAAWKSARQLHVDGAFLITESESAKGVVRRAPGHSCGRRVGEC